MLLGEIVAAMRHEQSKQNPSGYRARLHHICGLQELVFGDRSVEAVISEVVTERLSKQQYDPITGTKVKEVQKYFT